MDHAANYSALAEKSIRNRQSEIGSPPVLLINMPFGNLMTPSIGLGLLKGALKDSGISSKVFNFQLRFASLIGEQNYSRIHSATRTEHLAGEFIFSDALFGKRSDRVVKEYVEDILHGRAKGSSQDVPYSKGFIKELKESILRSRAHVESFLDECLSSIVPLAPQIVGFTSLFHQHVSSLALARRIKTQLPATRIIFGGSNCEGPMGAETLRQFEFVDAVVSGEAESVFPEIVRSVLEKNVLPRLPGVYIRDKRKLQMADERPVNTSTIENLDALPLPDYDEYFEQFEQQSLTAAQKPALLFETSRGCWWGAKHHCTFCGLNGETMAYRSKSAARAFSEFLYLMDTYPGCSINLVDNILDMKYFADFIPMLAERNHGLNLFYEVKANLSKEQVRLLAQAGINEIQPGIESFSDNVLRIMRKGVTALQNIQLMKWCKELGVKVYYNLIWGFPGEQRDDYLEMRRIIPLISHLQPPVGEGPIRLDRFSPNYEQAVELGFGKLSPHPAYQFVYPFASTSLEQIAYFFANQNGNTTNLTKYASAVARDVKTWRNVYPKSELFWMDKGKQLLIWDFRPVARERLVVLNGYERVAYMACDRIKTAKQVVDITHDVSGMEHVSAGEVRAALTSFVDLGLMINQGDTYLSLAFEKSLEPDERCR